MKVADKVDMRHRDFCELALCPCPQVVDRVQMILNSTKRIYVVNWAQLTGHMYTHSLKIYMCDAGFKWLSTAQSVNKR